VCLALVKLGESLDNGLSQAPPMGYNTWNDLGCKNMNEANIKAVANTLVDSGLRDAGFVYLNLDDCWMAPNRDASGRLQGNPETFPTGMKALADYIHSKGLKFGIYSDRGSATCQGLPASLGSEELDAQTFAEWDVDYLKHDNCHSSTGPNDKDQLFKEFGLMRDGLNATERPIFYSVCGGGAKSHGATLSTMPQTLLEAVRWQIPGESRRTLLSGSRANWPTSPMQSSQSTEAMVASMTPTCSWAPLTAVRGA